MMNRLHSQSGFSLAEVLIATGLMLVVSSIVTTALLQMTKHQQTVWNRTEMHSGVRGATELLQQEVGQAGKIALPAPVRVTAWPAIIFPVPTVACATNTLTLSSVAGMWVGVTGNAGILLTFLDGDNNETVRVTAITGDTAMTATTPGTITGCFWHNHAFGGVGVGTPVTAMGGFASGIVPPSGIVNGSTKNKLKLYGDINGDGNMVYVEYFCDNGDEWDPNPSPTHNLYRHIMKFDDPVAVKTASYSAPDAKILLTNIYPNPPDSLLVKRPCFEYQALPPVLVGGSLVTFVLDVAVTLTAKTQSKDSNTGDFATETKALLNVSPRNVFSAWAMVGMGYTDRIQTTPATVTALLP